MQANITSSTVRPYNAADYGKEEESRDLAYRLRKDDGDRYFKDFIKPRLNRSYKLYIAYGGDRAKLIQAWQANISVPYVLGVVETMKPRILDARPEFTVLGRNIEDEERAESAQKYLDHSWEKARLDDQTEDLVSASMIYGSGFMRNYWKKDVRKRKYLKGRDITTKKKKYVEREETLFDGPMAYTVDNYDMRYDWRNVPHESKQWFGERMIMNGHEIRAEFPEADNERLEKAFLNVGNADLTDHGSIRMETKSTHEETVKGSDRRGRGRRDSNVSMAMGDMTDRYQSTADPELQFHEVRLEFMPFRDEWQVRVNDVPVLADGYEPNPYNHKEDPYIHVPFLKLPFEYEGIGYPILLEQPQLMLNHIKNQRLDATTMGIHGMWIVNPQASIKKDQLVMRPYGIIYSSDPNGVREVKSQPVSESAYREEELLKSDMRYASGVDDLSMGIGGTAGSATETRNLRESTIERVRLYINHLGSGYSKLMRHFLSMGAQFMTEKQRLRITDEKGDVKYEFLERDDIKGEFDLIATVLPSISGKSDLDKRNGMDLFQILVNFPQLVDPKKLLSKVLHPWHWSLASLAPEPQPAIPGPEGMPQWQAMPKEPGAAEEIMNGSPMSPRGAIRPEVANQALELLGGPPDASMNMFGEAAAMQGMDPGAPAPQPSKAPAAGGRNNMGGKVNLNGGSSATGNSDPMTKMLNKASSPQRKG